MKNIIPTIIVDDEINARENLRYLTQTFCSEIEIIYEASNVDDAIVAIENYGPKLVFLDIEMPQKNGFQLIDHFKSINFYIIFVTAYDSYAINAFKVSALDYLLKPIEIQLLKKAVKKASEIIEKDSIKKRLQLLNENKKKIAKIAIPYKSDYVIIDVANIIAIQADRMYSIIHLVDRKTYIASKKLSYYEDIFKNSETLFRVHRSWIVNSNHIYMYSKKEKNIKLSDGSKIPISKSYKESFESLFGNS